MIFDSHVHTTFSSDSKMKIEEVLDYLKENNNMGVVLTEHLDLNYPDETMFRLNCEEYRNSYEKYRGDNLLIGIEVGLDEDTYVSKCNEIVEKYNWDFVLGSTHVVEGIDIYEKEYYVKPGTEELYDLDYVYNRYFNAMLRLIKKNDFFDSMSHIDYIARYAARFHENHQIYYENYSDVIDEILKVLVEKGKAIEINTRRLNTHENAEQLIKIYKRFKDLGGEYVTIGSDSHKKEVLGNNFKEAIEIANICNLKPVYFKERKINSF